MSQIQTTLTAHFAQSGTNARGAWTRHDFTSVSGEKYQTFDAAVANRVYGFSFGDANQPNNKPIVITYDEKPAKDPQYPPNKVITGIEAATVPEAPSVAPVASQTPPTVGVPVGSGGPDERQIQIMRQSALERAIRFVNGDPGAEGGTFEIYNLAEEFLNYFVTGEYPGKSEQQIVRDLENIAA